MDENVDLLTPQLLCLYDLLNVLIQTYHTSSAQDVRQSTVSELADLCDRGDCGSRFTVQPFHHHSYAGY